MNARAIHLSLKHFGGVGLLMLGLGLGQDSHAQSDPLAAICHGFLSSSGLPSPGNANILCKCLVEEVQANLTTAEMQAYQSATNSGRSAPAAVEAKVSAIAVNCLRRAQ